MAKEPSRRVIKSVLDIYNALLGLLVPEARRAFFAPSAFAWTARFERAWPTIRAELDAVLAAPARLPLFHEVEPGQDDISNERWTSLLFSVYGRSVPENCARCPKTAALLAEVPDVTLAMFSVLGPGSHIPPHHGPFKGVLRYHLGLIVPSGQGRCEIRVGGEYRRWEVGKGMVFDDTLEHEVWNETDERRVILFLDFLRPLPFPLGWINRLLMAVARWTPAVRNTQANARRLAGARPGHTAHEGA